MLRIIIHDYHQVYENNVFCLYVSSSDLVINQTLSESNVPVTLAMDGESIIPPQEINQEESSFCGEPGHSRNSSNTSQMSKASGYSSIHSHSHSRQSSSGDSGHIRYVFFY